MITSGEDIKTEMNELRKEIVRLRRVLTGDILYSFEKNIESRLKDILLSVISTLNDEVLRHKMPVKCRGYDECIKNFRLFLNEAIKEGIASEELRTLYEQKRDVLIQLENQAPYKKCSICFSEAIDLLKHQEKIMSIFRERIKNSPKYDVRPEEFDAEKLTNKIEPFSNTARIKILLELLKGQKRFGQLSKVTGLEGGNLRFHIKKLMDAGLISRQDRGLYTLTERGKIFFERLLALIYSL